QQGAWIDVTGAGFPVHRQCDGENDFPPQNSGQRPRFSHRRARPTADRVKIGSIEPFFLTSTACIVYPPLSAVRTQKRISADCLPPSAHAHERLDRERELSVCDRGEGRFPRNLRTCVPEPED